MINYGNRNKAYSATSPDIRIALGTNSGFLHFFADNLGDSLDYTDDTVSESWAFIPKELLSFIPTIRANSTLAANSREFYGIDGVVAVYKDDKNLDGNICKKDLDCNNDGFMDGDINHDGDTLDLNEGDDRVIIVFGLRRGGNTYYALDVTNPATPIFLWNFTHSEIQQSWGTPQFGKVQYFNKSTVETKTVAIVTAGYDADKYDFGATSDGVDQGRGLFMVDMDTGQIIWSVLNGLAGSSTKTTLLNPLLVDSVPAPAKVVDVNMDGILDRIYMPDLGGNVWRIDMYNLDTSTMYGSTNLYLSAVDSREFWSMIQLAKLGKTDVGAVDRRFFNQVDFVQTRDSNAVFDAVLLGSGHRNHPYDLTVMNRFYMIKDPKVTSYKLHASKCNAQDINCQTYVAITGYPLINTDLTDVTSVAATNYTAKGWRLDLGAVGAGEKSLSSSLTIKGNVSFTTYRPPATPDLCTDTDPASANYDPNQYKFYVLNLQLATAGFDLNKDDAVDLTDRFKNISHTGIPQKPFIITPDGKKLYILPSLGEDPIYDESTELQTQTHFWFKKSDKN